jgi:hypothetical protein
MEEEDTVLEGNDLFTVTIMRFYSHLKVNLTSFGFKYGAPKTTKKNFNIRYGFKFNSLQRIENVPILQTLYAKEELA